MLDFLRDNVNNPVICVTGVKKPLSGELVVDSWQFVVGSSQLVVRSWQFVVDSRQSEKRNAPP